MRIFTFKYLKGLLYIFCNVSFHYYIFVVIVPYSVLFSFSLFIFYLRDGSFLFKVFWGMKRTPKTLLMELLLYSGWHRRYIRVKFHFSHHAKYNLWFWWTFVTFAGLSSFPFASFWNCWKFYTCTWMLIYGNCKYFQTTFFTCYWIIYHIHWLLLSFTF